MMQFSFSFGFRLGPLSILIFPFFTGGTLLERIQYFCVFSWCPLFTLQILVCIYKPLFTRTFYAITDQRIITICGKKNRSIDTKDFSDIIVQRNRVVYFQEWLTPPEGEARINQLWLPLDQDETEIVEMLNTLKERGSSGNATLEIPQPHNSMNVIHMRPLVPPHIEEVINNELQDEEQVIQTVMPKQSIFQCTASFVLLEIGLCFLLVAVGVSLIPSIYFLIPLIFGLLVILLAVGVFWLCQDIVYVVTNCRAIKVIPGNWICNKKPLVYAFPPFQNSAVFRRDYPNGTGDVIFAHQWRRYVFDGFVNFDDGFFGVPNAKNIEKTLKELAKHTNAEGILV
jgi:hypothetical protein